MQLTPRYGNDPVITLDGSPAAVAGPVVRQRKRLAAALADFTDEQWLHPSRCAGWSARDVIVHLSSTNSFWTHSIATAVRGEPTRFLVRFDPVASPAQLVAGSGALSPAEVLDGFTASTDALVRVLGSLGDDEWTALAEAPPGHISVSAVAHHALWDAWVHERDILIPLGIRPAEEADEVVACLRYVAGLGPALAHNRGMTRSGTLAIETTGPEVSILVEVGDRVVVRDGTASTGLRLIGDAVELVEALSLRRPLGRSIPAEHAWLLSGLSETFDVVPG